MEVVDLILDTMVDKVVLVVEVDMLHLEEHLQEILDILVD